MTDNRREPRAPRVGFTSFNMEDENEEGHFDEAGNFIWNQEEKSVQEEAWLNGLSEQQINAAKSAMDRKAFRDEQEGETMTEEQANKILAALLQPRETVLQALKRLGSKGKRVGNKRKAAAMDGEEKLPTDEEKAQFVQITEAADFLMRAGEVDVYSQIKEEFIPEEELLRARQNVQVEQESKEGSEETTVSNAEVSKSNNEVMWEYKGADGVIYGPFSTSCFIAWQEQGYFKGDSVVEMRCITDQPATKTVSKSRPALSAEEELLNDFEDSEDEKDEKQESSSGAPEFVWQKSDQIDFKAYRNNVPTY